MKVRFWFKKSTLGSIVWRVFIGLLGGLVSIVGGIMLIGPGPGLLVILGGLGILATEFAWAGEVMLKAKKVASTAGKKSKLHPYVQYFIIAGTSVAGILFIYIFY
jgi:uncharacterized protein (TIGR02611 family)